MMINETAPNYTIIFNPNGGTVPPTNGTTNAEGKLTRLPTPTRSGSYNFNGWYTATSGGTRVTTSTVFDADATNYAQWTYTGGSSSSGGSSTSTTKNLDGSTTAFTTDKATGTVTVTTDKNGNVAGFNPPCPPRPLLRLQDRRGRDHARGGPGCQGH